MKVFYHADNDGQCAGFWVKRLADRDEYPTTFIKINYGIDFPFEDIKPNEIVYIVDYSIPPEEMDRLLAITPNVIWIDHHKSAIDRYVDYDKEIKGLRYDGIAGCMLTYIYLSHMAYAGLEFKESFVDTAPMFTKLIADYDVWTFKYGDKTRQFNKGFVLYPHEPEDDIWDELLLDEAIDGYRPLPQLDAICERGKTIIKYRESMMADYCDCKGFETEFEGCKSFAVNMAQLGSDDFIIPNSESYDLLIGFSFDGEIWTYSLRSTRVDCAEIAMKYGGGGHVGAAGFNSKELLLKKIM